MRYAFAVVPLIAALTAGCGRADDRAAVRATTERFLAAVDEHRGGDACAELSAQARQQLERDEQRACRRAVSALAVRRSAVTHVDMALTSAKVDLADGESVFLGEATGVQG